MSIPIFHCRYLLSDELIFNRSSKSGRLTSELADVYAFEASQESCDINPLNVYKIMASSTTVALGKTRKELNKINISIAYKTLWNTSHESSESDRSRLKSDGFDSYSPIDVVDCDHSIQHILMALFLNMDNLSWTTKRTYKLLFDWLYTMHMPFLLKGDYGWKFDNK